MNRRNNDKEKVGERRRVYQKSLREIITAFIILLCFCLFVSGFVCLLAYSYLESKYTIYEYAPKNETICQDGWHSYSLGPGTCSHHGGVRIWAGGSVSTGRFESGWWEKEKRKVYLLAAVLICFSVGCAGYMATRPGDLSPEDRAKIDEALKTMSQNLKK